MILGAILLALICWGVTFGWTGGNFWLKIGLSVIAVFTYSLVWQKPRIHLRFSSFLLGLLSAAILYAIFYLGHRLAPFFLAEASNQVGGVYSLGMGTPRIWVFLLLFCITGPGEEIFWRGFLQDHLMRRWGDFPGYLIATAVYAGVHIFSANPILILAALIAGAFWGLLYLWQRDLAAQITSHSFWSAFIFAVVPVQ